MKKSTLLLIATLLANASLVGVVAASRTSAEAKPAPTRRAATRADTARQGGPAVVAGSAAEPGVALDPGNLRLTSAQWEMLVNGDLKSLAAQLRSAGLPENAVSLVIYMQLRLRMKDEFERVNGFSGELPPFWRPEASAGVLNSTPEKRAAQQALNKQMTEMAQAALGTNDAEMMRKTMETNPDLVTSLRRQYGDIPIEKLVAIQELSRKFSEEQSGLLLGGTLLQADMAKLDDITKRREEAIAALMTPAEREGFELRSSQTASRLRSQLTVMDPTEAEFKALYQVQKAFDDKYGTLGAVTTPEQARERSLHQAELQEQLAAALPPDRAEQYKLAQLPGATQVPRLIERLNLPPSTTLDVLAIQKDMQDRVRATQVQLAEERTAEMAAARGSVQPGPGRAGAMNEANQLAAANYQANLVQRLGALNHEASSKLTAILGPSGFEAYKGYGGNWMNQLTPPPPPVARGALPPGAPVAR